jgi:hypothetical protein
VYALNRHAAACGQALRWPGRAQGECRLVCPHAYAWRFKAEAFRLHYSTTLEDQTEDHLALPRPSGPLPRDGAEPSGDSGIAQGARRHSKRASRLPRCVSPMATTSGSSFGPRCAGSRRSHSRVNADPWSYETANLQSTRFRTIRGHLPRSSW